MILESMKANQAEGVAMCDAHPDLEVFRLRLGKAHNYEFNEDTQTGLFQRRDPREGTLFHSSTIIGQTQTLSLLSRSHYRNN